MGRFERWVHYTIRLFYMAYLAWEPERHLISFHSAGTQTQVLIQPEMQLRSLLQWLWYEKAVIQTKKEDEYDFIVTWYCLCHTTSCLLLTISQKWFISRLKSKGIKLHSRIIKGVEVSQFSHSCNLQCVTRKCEFSLQQREQHLNLILQVTTIIHST